jgi:hypothetical protein
VTLSHSIPASTRLPFSSLLLVLGIGCGGGPSLSLSDVFGANGAGRDGANAMGAGGTNGGASSGGRGGNATAISGGTASSGSTTGDGNGGASTNASGGRGGVTSNGGNLTSETGGSGAGDTGGATSAGGAPDTGGKPALGGTPNATGGTLNTGGKAASGGTLNMGGALNTGGKAMTGGALNTGGKAASGGTPNTGGALSTGGKAASGGTPNATGGTGGSEPIGGCDQQLLTNADFDQGPSASWVETSTWPGVHIVTSKSDSKLVAEGVTPFSGNYLAWLGGIPDNEFDHHMVVLTQKVTIPVDASTLTLSGRRWVKTVEDTSQVFDESYLEFEGADESVVWQALWLTNLDAGTGWTAFEKATANVTALRGKTLTFVAYSRTDPGGKTSFFLDSLRLVATCGR